MGDSWGEAFDRFIPQWDGRAESIRQHKEDVSWWLAGVDLSKTASFNLAARYVRRQQHPGVAARLRALKPTDLEFTRAKYVDTDGSAVTADGAGAILDTPAILGEVNLRGQNVQTARAPRCFLPGHAPSTRRKGGFLPDTLWEGTR